MPGSRRSTRGLETLRTSLNDARRREARRVRAQTEQDGLPLLSAAEVKSIVQKEEQRRDKWERSVSRARSRLEATRLKLARSVARNRIVMGMRLGLEGEHPTGPRDAARSENRRPTREIAY